MRWKEVKGSHIAADRAAHNRLPSLLVTLGRARYRGAAFRRQSSSRSPLAAAWRAGRSSTPALAGSGAKRGEVVCGALKLRTVTVLPAAVRPSRNR